MTQDSCATCAPVASPFIHAPEETPPIRVDEVLKRDKFAPPRTLLERGDADLGCEPVPAKRYTSQHYFELEREKLWPKVWQMACCASDIPNPGDTHVYRILDRSVLVLRQNDGSIKALVNACLHRGRELADADGHHHELRCPYHFFTWDIAGSLTWIPAQWDFPQVRDGRCNQLPEIRVEEWNGFVFVNFDESAPPLKDYMGRMVDQWGDWDFNKRFKAVHVQKLLRCNWKTGQDAFIEGYHSFATHGHGVMVNMEDCAEVDVFIDSPHTNRFHICQGFPSHRLDPQPSAQEVLETFCSFMLPEAIGTDEGRLQDGEDSREACARIARKALSRNYGVDLSKTSNAEMLDAMSYLVFPNFMPWAGLSYPLVYRFRPGETPDTCIWDIMLFVPFEGERPPSPPMIKLGYDAPLLDVKELGGLALVFHQDAVQVPLVQSGMKNLQSGLLNVSRQQEARIRHYHQTLTRYLGE